MLFPRHYAIQWRAIPWLILGYIFVASSVVRKRIQIDIAFDEHDPRPLDEGEKKIFENIDLSI